MIFPTIVDKIKVEPPMSVPWRKSKKKMELLRCLAIAKLNLVREQLKTFPSYVVLILTFININLFKNISTKLCTSTYHLTLQNSVYWLNLKL